MNHDETSRRQSAGESIAAAVDQARRERDAVLAPGLGVDREEMRDRVAERLVRNRTNGLCPLDGPCASCDCLDPQHRYERDDAEHVLAEVWPEVERLTNERDITVRQRDRLAAERDDYRERVRNQMTAATELINTLTAAERELDDTRERLQSTRQSLERQLAVVQKIQRGRDELRAELACRDADREAADRHYLDRINDGGQP